MVSARASRTIPIPGPESHSSLFVLVLVILFGPLKSSLAEVIPEPVVEQQERIDSLIEGLGDESYATRQRCRNELSRIGLAAFDALRQARNHVDNEIATVARQLTAGLEVRWSEPSDSKRVRQLLTEYGSKSLNGRRQTIGQLSKLPADECFAALVRISRYEPNRALGRMAAVAGMYAPDQVEADVQIAVMARIVDSDDQPSSEWLRQHTLDLQRGELDLESWTRLLARHQLQMHSPDPDDTEPLRAGELLSVVMKCAKSAGRSGFDKVAAELLVRHVELIPAKTMDLLTTSTWALDNELYEAVVAIHSFHEDIVAASPLLLYWSATAHRHLGHDQLAASLAKRALRFNPLKAPSADDEHRSSNEDNTENEPDELPEFLRNERSESHVNVAYELSRRGAFDWSRLEYDYVISNLPIDSPYSTYARMRYSEMLAELQDHAGVIAVLEPLAVRLDKDANLKKILTRFRYPYPKIRSKIDFHLGQMQRASDAEAAGKLLRTAYESDPTNIDILIAMYRLDGDEEWTSYVGEEVEQATLEAENSIRAARTTPVNGFGRFNRLDISEALNNYAWLVCNTKGDFQRALRYSKLSLEEDPETPAYMDTCARCYFAIGDLESAVDMQRRALDLEPHSPPLRRQLEQFDAALRQQRSRPSNTTDADEDS
ncbi:MAG: hypothetical protein AAF670_02905 [Planctomycetota bacterium]